MQSPKWAVRSEVSSACASESGARGLFQPLFRASVRGGGRELEAGICRVRGGPRPAV